MNIINKSNKKGFTLVELLVVIVILGIITAMSIPLIRNISENGTNKKYSAYSQALVDSAKLYVNSYSKDLFGNNTTGCTYVKYSDLSSKKLTKDIQIENTSCNTDKTFVRVVKIGDKYSYVAQLGCGTVKNNKVEKVELRPNPGIEMNAQCSTNPTTRVTIEPTIKSETSLTKKSVTLQVKLTSLTGFQNNAIRVKYTWSTSMNSVDAGAEWKELDFPTTPSAKDQKAQILANKEITLKSTTKTKITTPAGKTGQYYLVIRPEVINDVSGNDILLDDKNKNIYRGPYIIDNTPPTIPDIKFYKWMSNSSSYRPNDKSTGLLSYTAGSWSDRYIIAIPSASDTISGTDLTYKYTTAGKTTNETDVEARFRNIEAEGKSTIKFKACDKAGNCSDYSDAKEVNIDTIYPTISVISVKSTNDKYNDLTAIAKISAYDKYSDNELQMCVSTENYCTTWIPFAEEQEITFSGTLDGKTRTVYVSVKDAAGNVTKRKQNYIVYEECGSSNTKSDENWVNDGDCTKACGSGEQNQISGTVDKNTGKACSGTKSKKVACNTQGCCDKTHNVYGDYGSWSACSKLCGTGTRTRTRTVSKYSDYDNSFCGSSPETQTENCNTYGCCSRTYTNYGPYWGWSTCTAACNGGTQTNSRTATDYSSYDNSVCSTWTQTISQKCNTQSCCTITAFSGKYCYNFFGPSCYKTGVDGCSNTWVCAGYDTGCEAANSANCNKLGGKFNYFKKC